MINIDFKFVKKIEKCDARIKRQHNSIHFHLMIKLNNKLKL